MIPLLLQLSEVMRWPERLRYRRMLEARQMQPPPVSNGICLNYGGALGAGRLAGGRVKLSHLAERWPEADPFHILYLVSSAPPAHALVLARWAKRRGAKLVWNQNGVGFPAWAGLGTANVNAPLSALLLEADHVVYQSDFCRRSADHWLGRATCPHTVLHNPVDTTTFSPAPLPPPPSEGWRLLAAGTHYQPFRVLGALEAVRVLLDAGHRVTLTVAGEMRWSGAESEVHSAIERLRLAERVTLLPAFTQTEAAALYRQAHVLLHLKYYDPCPTVAIEALASGLPVVASDTGGMPELIGDDGGELIHVAKDWQRPTYPPPRRIAAAIARLMQNWPNFSAAATARARRLFHKHGWLAAHEAIFHRLLPR